MSSPKSCGSEVDISSLIAPNLAAGARLAAENQCQALDEKTARTYELRLIALENFAMANGDDAVLFWPQQTTISSRHNTDLYA